MDHKALFCCFLVVFLCSFPSSLQENVTITVKSVTTIAQTDADFVCVTLDWWPKDKCNYGMCPWGNTSVLNMDLSNPVLRNTVKAFGRLRVRIGGTLQDNVLYDVGKRLPICQDFRTVTNESEGLFGFSTGCLNMSRWDELNHFFSDTGVVLTFGLNALNGRKKSNNTLYVGNWDISNALALIQYTASKGYNVESWELGNELCGGGVGAKVDAWQYGKDMINLKFVVDQVYRTSSSKPKVLAPGGFYDKDWFNQMLQVSGPDVIDGVTHHIYNLGSGDDPDLLNKIQDPYYLDGTAQTFRDVANTVKEFGPWSAAWVGEAGGAYNSGGRNVSDTYVNSFWYLDQLGMTSTFDHKVYCRQALIGGNYALLNNITFAPNPDYYSLETTHNGSPYLRAYTHCSKDQEGVTILLINMSNSTGFDVSITDDLNMYPTQYSSTSTPSGGQREEYHLTPKDGNIQSKVMLLNGEPLMLTTSGDVPQMNPISSNSSAPLRIAPLSIAFARIKDFIAPTC
ncbi:hypothetical protein HPP92_023627 [Vanilla planifolia]|uniref:Uncharacterized protein n=1 Tax=Vanilla planifolia TaxID=51239 RepID=A0A835UET8_VANPL|nr:hypothetical protein HPP92_023627 [Vanilla planifolia]